MLKYGHYGIFDFIWGIIYEQTSDIHMSGPAIQVNTLPMVNNQLHWCLLNLLVKGHFKLSIILLWENVLQHKITAINLIGPGISAQDTS